MSKLRSLAEELGAKYSSRENSIIVYIMKKSYNLLAAGKREWSSIFEGEFTASSYTTGALRAHTYKNLLYSTELKANK